MNPQLSLVVLRVADIERSKNFYAIFGLNFVREQHGSGLEHYAAVLNGTVVELYPCGANRPTTGIRLGFLVRSLKDVLAAAETLGAKVHAAPIADAWEAYAVLLDPDGNRVEVRQRAIQPGKKE
jgi:lactoylglutathione lyase